MKSSQPVEESSSCGMESLLINACSGSLETWCAKAVTEIAKTARAPAIRTWIIGFFM